MISKYISKFKPVHNTILIGCISTLLSACGFLQYVAKPIDTKEIAVKLSSKSPVSEEFQRFLMNSGYSREQLPLQRWGAEELTYCALFFHPDLDVARAKLRTAEAIKLSAAEKPYPAISGNIAHSNNANQDISPYAFGLSIDIPIETAHKRNIHIEHAEHLSTIAKLEIAQTAWQLRNQVVQALHEHQFNQHQIALLSKEQASRQEIVNILKKRLSLGAASNVELSVAKLQLQNISAELTAKQQSKLVLLSVLAGHLGLPLNKVESMQLAEDSYLTAATQPQEISSIIQSTALLNRLDIRIALEKYAAAEAKLKLEIARQYPDITISPGYAYEFGNKVWSLGISSLITLLHKNKLAIAEATQVRETEALQFEALQSTVISEANSANAKLAQARQAWSQQNALFAQQKLNTSRMARRLAAGEIDRLEFTFSKLEEITAEKTLVQAHFDVKTAVNHLENTLQQPLAGQVGQLKPEE